MKTLCIEAGKQLVIGLLSAERPMREISPNRDLEQGGFKRGEVYLVVADQRHRDGALVSTHTGEK